MPGEIVQIYIGQAGVQLANACWELYSLEHNIGVNGFLRSESQPDIHREENNVIYEELMTGRYIPRAVIVDSEATVVDEIRVGPFRQLFCSENILSGSEDASSNFARGYHAVSTILLDPVCSVLRRLIEGCNGLQAIIIHNSFGGGTGSGFMSSLATRFLVDVHKSNCIDFGIIPSSTLSSGPIEPYNTVLAFKALENIDLAILQDNKAIMKICNEKLFINRPTVNSINRVIAQVICIMMLANEERPFLNCNFFKKAISGVLASVRFPGPLSVKLTDLPINLVPFPDAHYIISGFSPFIQCEIKEKRDLDICNITRSVFQSDNYLITSHQVSPIYLTSCMLYRGNVSCREVNTSIDALKHSENHIMVDWCPTGFKVGINLQPMTTVESSRIGQSDKSLVALHNSTSLIEILDNLLDKFNKLFKYQSFMHWYESEGIGINEMKDAFNHVQNLTNSYKDLKAYSSINNGNETTYQKPENDDHPLKTTQLSIISTILQIKHVNLVKMEMKLKSTIKIYRFPLKNHFKVHYYG